MPPSSLLFHSVLEVIATAIRQGKQRGPETLRVSGKWCEGGGLGPHREHLKLTDGTSGEAQNFHQQEVFSPKICWAVN